MDNNHPDSDKSRRFTTDEMIMAGTPILLILLVIVTILLAPKILQSWEVKRCLELKATFDYERGECIVTRRELQ
jgi:hypothetical protein